MLWQIEKFVNLKGSQEEQAKIYLDNFHQWHRRTQLEQYAQYLVQLKARINTGPISGEDIHAETDKMQELLDQSLNQLLPDMARIIAKLTDAQAEELLESIKKENVKNITIGIPKEYFSDNLDSKISDILNVSIEAFKKLGFNFREVSLPNHNYTIPAYYIIASAEASSNLSISLYKLPKL